MAARCDAHEHAERVFQPEHFPETKTGIEMVACAGGDARFWNIRSFHDVGAAFRRGERVSHWMHDDCVYRKATVDLEREIGQTLRRMIRSLQPKHVADFAR